MEKNWVKVNYVSAHSYSYMKPKLTEHFGDKIIETEINGKPNVITFKKKAMLFDFYSHYNFDPEKTN